MEELRKSRIFHAELAAEVHGCGEQAAISMDNTECKRRSPLSLSRFTSGFRASTSGLVIPLLLMMSAMSSPERTGYVL